MAALINIRSQKSDHWCKRLQSTCQAHELGLITNLTSKEKVDDTVHSLIEELKENSPSAIRLGLEALKK